MQEIALRAVHRDRRAGRGAGQRAGAGGADGRGRRPDLVLRQRGRPLRRGDVQDAGVRRAVGRDHPRAVRRHRPEAAPVPVRRAGQLARPDRGAAGEQRPADRAGDARRSRCPSTPGPAPSSCRPGTRRWACPGPGTSSGACGSSRCWRTSRTCWSTATCSTARPVVEAKVGRARGRRPGRDRPGAGDGRGGAGGGVRLPQAGAGRLARGPAARIESGEDEVVGVNRFPGTEPSPADRGPGRRGHSVDPEVEARAAGAVAAWRAERDDRAGRRRSAALDRLRADAAQPGRT